MEWKTGWFMARWQAFGVEAVSYKPKYDFLADIEGKSGLFYLKHVHDTRESAITAAEKARAKRIAGLKKQIAKLEAMTF